MSKKVNVEEIVKQIQEAVRREQKEKTFLPRYYEFMEQIRTYQKIIIVGAGVWGNALLEQLRDNRITASLCFADNAYEKYPNGLLGQAVLSLEEAAGTYVDAGFVVTPHRYRFPLVRQLVNAGIDINQILIFDAENMGLKI